MAPIKKTALKTKRSRRTYSDEFKDNAVKLVTGGSTVAQVARNLRIPESALRLWVGGGGAGGGGLVANRGAQMYFLQRVDVGGLWRDIGAFSTGEQAINAINTLVRKDADLRMKDLRVFFGYEQSVMPGLAPAALKQTGRARGIAQAHTNGNGHGRRPRARAPETLHA